MLERIGGSRLGQLGRADSHFEGLYQRALFDWLVQQGGSACALCRIFQLASPQRCHQHYRNARHFAANEGHHLQSAYPWQVEVEENAIDVARPPRGENVLTSSVEQRMELVRFEEDTKRFSDSVVIVHDDNSRRIPNVR